MNHRLAVGFLVTMVGSAGFLVYQGRESSTADQASQAASAAYGHCPKNPPNAPLPKNQLDSCIRAALKIMDEQGIPGSFEGIKRNVIRESGGNPRICNNWDINAQNGTPSCGLLQTIGPTFEAHHCPGTVDSFYDPIANLCAASHYAWKRYDSIDNVNGPY